MNEVYSVIDRFHFSIGFDVQILKSSTVIVVKSIEIPTADLVRLPVKL